VIFGVCTAVLVPAVLVGVLTILQGLRGEVTASSGTR
jgi:hypothetical protein